MTVLTFITDAYRMANIVGETETPSAEQASKAITRLNDLMASLAEDGIDLGYNPKSSTTDALELPLGMIGGLKAMLCVDLCGDIALDVPPVVAGKAEATYERLLRQAVLAQNTPIRLRHIDPGAANFRVYNIVTDE